MTEGYIRISTVQPAVQLPPLPKADSYPHLRRSAAIMRGDLSMAHSARCARSSFSDSMRLGCCSANASRHTCGREGVAGKIILAGGQCWRRLLWYGAAR